MNEFKRLQEKMIREQIIKRGIKNKKVLDALSNVPRHLFVPEKFQHESYEDHPIPLSSGQTISQPYIVALMSDVLHLSGKEKILEIGTGSGYQTAILAELGKEVFTIERYEELTHYAKAVFKKLTYPHVHFFTGDGSKGLEEFSPYDRIVVTAGAPKVPQPLFAQLAEGGKLIIPLGMKFAQGLTLVEKHDGKMTEKSICGCVFVPLVGEFGHSDKGFLSL